MNTVEHKQNILEVKYQGCTKKLQHIHGMFHQDDLVSL